MTSRVRACAVAALALLAAPLAAQPLGEPAEVADSVSAALPEAARDLSVADYAARLQAIADALRMGDQTQARVLAEALRTSRIAWQGESLAPDDALLDDVRHVSTPSAPRLAGRIERLARDLRSAPLLAPAEPPQPEVLARVTPADDLSPGGKVSVSLPAAPRGPLERLGSALQDFAEWVDRLLKKVKDWLQRFWPRAPGRAVRPGDLSRTTTIVLAVIALTTVALVLLAVRAVRRTPEAAGEDAAALASAARRDNDPLSREADEWEQYAQTLAASGRHREAIRAWYHAVLVALFRRGLLHYAKGRTNWEYVTSLTPELAWRVSFVELTRGFDREWYGREASNAEALSAHTRQSRSILRALRGVEAGA